MVNKKLIKIREDSDGRRYEKVEGMNPEGTKVNCCPFCDTHTQSGSWTPDYCPECGAVYFFGAWTRDIK